MMHDNVQSTDRTQDVRALYAAIELSPQLIFYNRVLKIIFDAAYHALPNKLQFREYTRSQQVHQWKLRAECNAIKEKVESIKTGNTKNANLKKVYDYVTVIKVCKEIDFKPLKDSIDYLLKQTSRCIESEGAIRNLRKSLYNSDCILRKHWRITEVTFYAELLDEYEEYRNLFEKSVRYMEEIVKELRNKCSKITLEELGEKRSRKRKSENKFTAKKRKVNRWAEKGLELLAKTCTDKAIMEKINEFRKESGDSIRFLRSLNIENINVDSSMKPRFFLEPLIYLIDLGVMHSTMRRAGG